MHIQGLRPWGRPLWVEARQPPHARLMMGLRTFRVFDPALYSGASVAVNSGEADCGLDANEDEQAIAGITPSGDMLHVELSEPAAADVSLVVSSVLGGGEAVVASVMPGDAGADIFVGTLKPGVYALTCQVDGRVVDVVKFTKR